jgi:hypothetical protein
MNAKIQEIGIPNSVDDLNLVEVLKEEFNILATDINGKIKLPEGAVMPSDEEIAAAKLNLLGKYQSIEYARNRGNSYPALREQLDALYHDIVNGNLTESNSTFVSMIKAVKDQYPKPE